MMDAINCMPQTAEKDVHLNRHVETYGKSETGSGAAANEYARVYIHNETGSRIFRETLNGFGKGLLAFSALDVDRIVLRMWIRRSER
jgi:hypothetical protein